MTTHQNIQVVTNTVLRNRQWCISHSHTSFRSANGLCLAVITPWPRDWTDRTLSLTLTLQPTQRLVSLAYLNLLPSSVLPSQHCFGMDETKLRWTSFLTGETFQNVLYWFTTLQKDSCSWLFLNYCSKLIKFIIFLLFKIPEALRNIPYLFRKCYC